jgi:hypothetical protein
MTVITPLKALRITVHPLDEPKINLPDNFHGVGVLAALVLDRLIRGGIGSSPWGLPQLLPGPFIPVSRKGYPLFKMRGGVAVF